MPKGQYIRTYAHRIKMAKATKGKPKSTEHKKALSESKKGATLSVSQREEIKAGMRRLWRSRNPDCSQPKIITLD